MENSVPFQAYVKLRCRWKALPYFSDYLDKVKPEEDRWQNINVDGETGVPTVGCCSRVTTGTKFGLKIVARNGEVAAGFLFIQHFTRLCTSSFYRQIITKKRFFPLLLQRSTVNFEPKYFNFDKFRLFTNCIVRR